MIAVVSLLAAFGFVPGSDAAPAGVPSVPEAVAAVKTKLMGPMVQFSFGKDKKRQIKIVSVEFAEEMLTIVEEIKIVPNRGDTVISQTRIVIPVAKVSDATVVDATWRGVEVTSAEDVIETWSRPVSDPLAKPSMSKDTKLPVSNPQTAKELKVELLRLVAAVKASGQASPASPPKAL